MATGTRTIRHLRLRGSDGAGVRRTVTVLEDALRIASLPDPGGRILLVRRLALGRIHPRAGPTTLARALERAMAGAEVEYRHGAEPGAADAPGVWFRDALDAHAALARRVTEGPPPREWYWPLAVPRWDRRMDRSEAFRAMAASLADLPEAPVALPGWVAALARSGALDHLEGSLRLADLPRLARGSGVSPEGGAGSLGRAAGGRGRAASSSPGAGEPRGAPPRRGPPASAERAAVRVFLSGLVRAGGGRPPEAPGASRHPGTTGRRERSRAAETDGRRVPGPGAPRQDSGAVATQRTGRSRPAPASADTPLPPEPGTEPGSGPGPSPGAAGGITRSGERRGSASTPRPRSAGPAGDHRAESPWLPTSAGGLLFLTGVLARLGYPEWLARHPEWASEEVALRTLAAVLRRLGARSGDPAWDVVATAPRRGAPPRTPRTFVAPARWREGLLSGDGPLRLGRSDRAACLHDPSGRLLLAAWRGSAPAELRPDVADAAAVPFAPGAARGREQVVEAWGTAARRWLRRYAGIGVADLVLRPARLVVTPTHLDVWLDLDLADVRVRRAGLDLDPGWLPWLGRVVGFHYGPTTTPATPTTPAAPGTPDVRR